MNELAIYKIRFKGHLSAQWSGWFNGMEIDQLKNGETCLKGLLMDQAALYGVLGCIRDLGLVLTALERIEVEENLEGAASMDAAPNKGTYGRH
jgi:hypothetical protein